MSGCTSNELTIFRLTHDRFRGTELSEPDVLNVKSASEDDLSPLYQRLRTFAHAMPPDDATFGIENLKLEADPSLPQKHRDRTGRTIADISSYEDKDGRTYHGWMAGG